MKWGAVATVWGQFLFLVRSVALAHLLSREDFGLMGMIASVMLGFNMLTNFGLNTAIIAGQYENDAELHSHLNTIWTADLIRSALVTLFLIAAAFPTAAFYGDARLAPLLAVTCLAVLVQGFENKGLVLLKRDVKWKSNAIYQVVNTTLTSMAPVVIALWQRDVWALVWGQLAATAVSVSFSYLFHPFRPRFELDPLALKRSIKFGKSFIVISVMVYITTTADNIFIGKILGPAALGGYLIAYNISNMPQNIISKVLSSVLFPVFAALNREDSERMAPAISRVLGVSTALLTLILVPMAVLAPEIIAAFFGPKWKDSVAPLRILLLPGLFRGLLQNVTPIVMALNRPDLEARSKVAEAILFVGALSVLVPRYGVIGAASASALAYFLAVVVRYYFVSRLVPGGFSALPATLATMAIAATGGAGAGFLALYPLQNAHPALRLALVTPLIWLVTGIFLLRLRPALRSEIERYVPRGKWSKFLKSA